MGAMLFIGCGSKSNAWYCDQDGFYEYQAIISMQVEPNQSIYHVGDTVTINFVWPLLFTDSLSNVTFAYDNQQLANPFVKVYYLEDDSLYPAIGIDTTFDLVAVYGSAPETYLGNYPHYYVDFAQTDTALLLQYKLIFHTPGRYLHYIEMQPFSPEDLTLDSVDNCLYGEIVQFRFNTSGDDHYNLVHTTPHPWELGLTYSCYLCFHNAGGFVFNVQP